MTCFLIYDIYKWIFSPVLSGKVRLGVHPISAVVTTETKANKEGWRANSRSNYAWRLKQEKKASSKRGVRRRVHRQIKETGAPRRPGRPGKAHCLIGSNIQRFVSGESGSACKTARWYKTKAPPRGVPPPGACINREQISGWVGCVYQNKSWPESLAEFAGREEAKFFQ